MQHRSSTAPTGRDPLRRRLYRLVLFTFLLPCAFTLLLSAGRAGKPVIYVLKLEGDINPFSGDYIISSIAKAEKDEARCLIIELDTPGGLLDTTRDITKAILAARIPIIMYVAPSGSRAASAGTYIAYACHVVAMAPGTNIGAAHPVTIGEGRADETMVEKAENDAVAYILSLAGQRNRNPEWAEAAVRKSVSIAEERALELGVTDFIAKDLDALLDKLDGYIVPLTKDGEEVEIRTGNCEVRFHPMGYHRHILHMISNPTVAYILMLLGFYGIYFELANPGAIFPGVVGGLCLILAFTAFRVLPINYAGFLLILLALLLFMLDLKIQSYGLLSLGGVVAMILGSLMLIDTDVAPFAKISLKVIIPAVVFTALFFIFAASLAIKAHMRKSVTGTEGLIGETGEVARALEPDGQVYIHGEYWRAYSSGPVPKGRRVRVVKVDKMRLEVEDIDHKPERGND
jgi:membrane-bound serine protease (ClpP class)